MTEQTKHEGGDLVQRLVRLADQGPEIPAGGADRLRAQIRPLWEREVRSRKTRHAAYWAGGVVALAATIAIVLLAPPLRRQPPPLSIAPAAFIEVVSGAIEIHSPGDEPTRIERGGTDRGIEMGSELRTGNSDRAAIRLLNGALVRIDAASALRLTAAGVIALDRGGIYINSASGGPLEVWTPLGVARDIGTQFEVRSDASSLTVKVRRGTVAVQPKTGAPLTVESGTAVSFDTEGSRSTASIATSSGEWNWTLDVASTPDIEGMPVASLLDWISSEAGLEIRYENAETERFARSTLLHGSLGRLRPDQIAGAVLPGAGLEAEERPGELLIRRSP